MMTSPSNTFWLTTDLDGTLIPVERNRERHQAALKQLAQWAEQRSDREIVFVTGRHLDSVLKVLKEACLPIPHSIITDVGSRIWNAIDGQWVSDAAYDSQLHALTEGVSMQQLQRVLEPISGLQLQVPAHQGLHKLSFECESQQLERCTQAVQERLERDQLSFSVTASLDPFSNSGLIDLLPKGVNKRFAIDWFCSEESGRKADQVLFCGDSGNDLEVFLSPIPSVVVHNTPASVKQCVVDSIEAGKTPRESIHLAAEDSTSGVLEGALHYGWFDR